MPVKNSDTVSAEIKELHDTYGLSFREIANLPTYRPIPFGTIAMIYHGGRVPNKWRKQLNMPKLVKVPETMVRKNAPAGTGRKRPRRIPIYPSPEYIENNVTAIIKHFETKDVIALIVELEERMKDG